MKSAALTILLLSLAKEALAFSSISSSSSLRSTTTTSSSPLFATANNDDDNSLSRRDLFTQTISLTAAATTTTLGLFSPLIATAAEPASTVVVAGATGQTGRRVLERLASQPNTSVIAAVRNTDKASKSLSESSSAINLRGGLILT
eukprot:scaffold9588_cov134-Skeletonema_marinoi.AAC.2